PLPVVREAAGGIELNAFERALWLRRRIGRRVIECEDLLHDAFAGIADAVRAVVGAQEVLHHAAITAIDAFDADGEIRSDLALPTNQVFVDVLILDVRIGRLGEAAENR